ncbi:HlyD family type I secretion periplasmic adaptor subunit [Pseudoduganella sp. SL102]|uniref:Membrane fusion protein (MFP) family protein n=1 Tax=Pseudoduganella albidiflava TaxID=321983 RepID=A0A411WT37_9BURK|nr:MULTISPECIES: HlyD family type I secretion periplasmic adaptor subunit [Pseudoduganella]QBH99939.1 HlyD family type I secretion periplasmic adaptor subunit [Pseudoduganella albidiflava]WBS02049.1 HlyD family type I secretion periplasmic adaptor subunit [Pseudoduganella sp. SL102]GGY55015.1 metalloprotease secretion protein [Pseudoduganella albidiflava]
MKLITKNASDVVAHDVTPLEVDTDARSFSRIGWLVVLIGFGGFLLWAIFAPLDRGVPMSGYVAKESNRKAVQHLTGGVVQEILVKDGDVVKEGQVLVRMNEVQVKSQAETTRTQYYAARAAEARLLAERDGAKSITYPKDLLDNASDLRAATNMEVQRQLFTSRQGSLNSELSAIEETIRGLQAQVNGLQEARKSKKAQLASIQEQLVGMRDLAKEGFVARNRLLELERMYIQVGGQISEDDGNIGRYQSQIMEYRLRAIQRRQDYQKEVRTELSNIQREADAQGARLAANDYELRNVEVKAPVSGIVVNLAVFTEGGVVASGFRMMDIVPSGDAMVVEGQLPVNLVDKVHAGLPVELIFSAFNTTKTPHLPGEVINVSADRTVDEHTGQPYYKVRAKVTPEGQKLIAEKKLVVQPGMPVDLFVKTGERSMMSYLLKPLTDRAKLSMSEE